MNEHAGARRVLGWYMTLPQQMHIEGRIADELKKQIICETDPGALRTLRSLLAEEYAAHGRQGDAESLYLSLHRQQPDSPLPLISLAGNKLYYNNDPTNAMRIIDQAIELAMRSGNFRRLALGTKARTALTLEAYGIVEDVLKQLMNLKFARGNIDCGIERDFLDRLPPGAIDEDVAQEYDRFSRSSRDS